MDIGGHIISDVAVPDYKQMKVIASLKKPHNDFVIIIKIFLVMSGCNSKDIKDWNSNIKLALDKMKCLDKFDYDLIDTKALNSVTHSITNFRHDIGRLRGTSPELADLYRWIISVNEYQKTATVLK